MSKADELLDDIPLDSVSVSCLSVILAVGMIIMILVSVLTAYMEAMLYLRSQQTSTSQSNGGQASTQSNHHHSGGSSKDCERNNCLNHSDACSKDRSNGNGHGAAAISASISSHQPALPFDALNNAIGKNNNLNANSNCNNGLNLNNNKSTSNKANNCAQKRRKNSSSATSEKVPMNNKSTGSTSNDKKSSSPYAPIFQNLTNVIASPPPPLPTFDAEFDSLEFKKLRGKKSTKKSNSLSGSIAGSDDVGNPSSLQQGNIASGSNQANNKPKTNGKANSFKMNGSCSTSSERYDVDQAQLDRASPSTTQDSKSNLKDVFEADGTSCLNNTKLYKGVTADRSQMKDQPTVMPIQPPSSLSSTPSSPSSSAASTSSATSSKSSSTSSSSSSTSSSPPLSATSYGEYSLLGPGATFELPCLRVRSAQI